MSETKLENMTENQRKIIIENLIYLKSLNSLSSSQIRTLTKDFDKSVVRDIINNIRPVNDIPFGASVDEVKEERKKTINCLRQAFYSEHFVRYEFNEPVYDEDLPDYFDVFDMLIKAGLDINYDEKTSELPQSPSDADFADLCKSLIEQRDYFIKSAQKMNEVLGVFAHEDDAKKTYQNILKLSQTIENKNNEIAELKKQISTLKTQLDEVQKMAAKVAKKSGNEEIIAALKAFLSTSKNKGLGKREAVADVMKDFVQRLNITDQDLLETLGHIDDERDSVVQNIEEQNNYTGNAVHQDNRKQLNVIPTAQLPEPESYYDDLPF